ncbi:aromatase/cyclase [Nonomuraea polychroma]|uniref:aromatase/cyclase n=1 Tax=Nonomuraea polychroma TaxID=46176 RepID=UPI003D92812A
MPANTQREIEHGIDVAAPAETVYRIVADAIAWPQIFQPTVHVERLEHGEGWERLQIWATANGSAKVWTSRRELAPARLRVGFRQERSQHPVEAMHGEWIIERVAQTGCRVRLLHAYSAGGDDPAALAWIDRAVDRNSLAELSALKDHAEAVGTAAEPLMTFDDTVDIDGAAEDVYDFVNEARLWQERLPHVSRVHLEEETPGLQVLEMDTRAPNGSVHTTKSVRVCRPYEWITYKQVQPPALLTLHTGQWLIDERPEGGVSVTSRHTVRINEANISTVLGDGAGMTDARTFVRDALGANSRVTLARAKAYAERQG